MRLINIKDSSGDTYIINPINVIEIKLAESEYAKDYCIILFLRSGKTHTIKCQSVDERDAILVDINYALESIS